MVMLLELKEKVKKIFGKYDIYIIPAAKFLVALISMIALNSSIGYMTKLKNPLVVLFISIICAFMPGSFTVLALSAVMLAHLYFISAELAIVALCLFLIMYLLYFRFTPRSGYVLILTVVLCWFRLPYLVPIAIGLTSGAFSFIPASFGIMIYYIIRTASEYEKAISGETASDSVKKFSFIIDSLLNNSAMTITIIAVTVAMLVVYVIRRLSIENSWLYAIVSGAFVQFIMLIIGKLAFSANISVLMVIVGTILAIILGYLLQILFFSVDYKRTEFVQYEDDDYYYYVKAVPKVNITNADVKVKRINAQKAKRTDNIGHERKYETRKLSNKPSGKDMEDDNDDDFTFLDR